jgi:hypothetical protein
MGSPHESLATTRLSTPLMITPVLIYIIHNILPTDADLFSLVDQNSIYDDLLIALQLAHDTNKTCIT